MSDLLIQHPNLSAEQIDCVGQILARPPDRSGPGWARWRNQVCSDALIETIEATAELDAEVVDPQLRLSHFRLAAFDMDSTLITIECVDELADFAGRKAEVAAITEAAMRGELADYDDSLRRRVALLEGLPVSVLQRVWDERLRLSPGVERLLPALRSAGLKILLVSGGFTWFTERLSARLQIDFNRANALATRGGYLTGALQGEIVNAEAKRQTLLDTCAHIGCRPDQAIAIGDGANDLLMMGAAGVSIAYRAKPRVRSETRHAINYCGLDAVLNLFGASEHE
ncbi:MAG: hypothetical protein RL322_1239 [Pseudomonadota bacterium]